MDRNSSRRGVVGWVSGGLMAAAIPQDSKGHPLFATRNREGLYTFGTREPMLDLQNASSSPIIIDRFDLVQLSEESILLRVMSRDGAMGVTAASPNKWAELRAQHAACRMWH